MKLFISNLPLTFTEQHLRGLLEEHCDILRLELKTCQQTGKSKGMALLEVSDPRQGQLLIKALNGFDIYCRPLSICEIL